VFLAHGLGIKPLRTTFCESLQDRPLPRRALFPEALVILGVAGDQPSSNAANILPTEHSAASASAPSLHSQTTETKSPRRLLRQPAHLLIVLGDEKTDHHHTFLAAARDVMECVPRGGR